MQMNTTPPLKELVPVTARGEATRRKLLASAETEIGNKGFATASVSSITQRADVGQGTFYLYFHSKEEVFATLVREIAAAQCAELAALPKAANGERALAAALLEFVAAHPGRHRILREAQFVDAPVYREAQDQLIAAIARVLSAQRTGPDAALKLRAAALLGAAECAGLLHCQWVGKPVDQSLIDAVVG